MKHKIYRIDAEWLLGELLKLTIIGIVTHICFFCRLWGLILEIPMLGFMFRSDYRKKIEDIKDTYINIFGDAMHIVAAGVGAGRSLENAFIEAIEDIENREINVLIKNEWRKIFAGLNCNRDIVELLEDMSIRSEIGEIRKLSWLIGMAKTHGGNLIKLINSFNQSISRKRILNEEIKTMIAEKKLEGNIMLLMPYLIVLYVRLVNPGYLNVMYMTIMGQTVMGIAVIMVFGAYLIRDRIIEGVMR